MFQVRDTNQGDLKYAGRSKAVVIDNKDPQKRGRVQVNSPLLGEESIWITYLTPPHTFTMPSVGDMVYVEADCGHITHPVAWGNATKEGGGFVPEVFLRDEPTNRGMYTPKSLIPIVGYKNNIDQHLFEIDDASGTSGIRWTSAKGAAVHIDDENDDVKLASPGSLALDPDTWSVSSPNGIQGFTPAGGGNTFSMNGGVIELKAAAEYGNLTLSSSGWALEDGASNSIASSASGIALADVSGNSITTSATGTEIANSTGATIATSSAGLILKAASGDDVLAIIEELLDALTSATYPGFGAPASNVANYPLIKAKVTLMKG